MLPLRSDISADAPQIVADAWQRVTSMWNAPLSARGVDTPLQEPKTVTVTFENGEVIVFKVIAEQPQLILAREDLNVRFHVSAASIQELLTLQQPSPKAEKPPANKAEPVAG